MPSLKSFVRASAIALATSMVAPAGIAGAGVAQPLEADPAERSAAGQCADVVVVAARGSGQIQTEPNALYTSNGWEGPHISSFLQHAEARYQERNSGASLFDHVEVLGLDDSAFPAGPAEELMPNLDDEAGIAQELSSIVQPGQASIVDNAPLMAESFVESVQRGRVGSMEAIENFEAETGCTPQYILVGYSQGVMVLAEHERELAERGQLAGVLYFGNPMTSPSDRTTIGRPAGTYGVLGQLPENSTTVAATPNRLNYCITADPVCDATPQGLRNTMNTPGAHELYFQDNSQWNDYIADEFAAWVAEARA